MTAGSPGQTIFEVIQMNDTIFHGATPEDNAQMQQYFSTLPPYIQESIYQSGIPMNSLEELKSCARHMTEGSE